MTPKEFKALPPLVGISVLRDCGFNTKMVDALAYRLQNGKDKAPARRIGFIKPSKRKRLFFKVDLAVLLPWEFRD